MELSEMIKVLQHYDNGGEVEYREKESTNDWRKIATPFWDWDTYVYRIKELKQKVTIEKWLCQNGQGNYAIIESTNVNQYKSNEKVKLIESYEVEL